MGAVIMRYGGLAMAIAMGLILRFWNLDLKPLWLDETITLLFSLGRRYDDIPREVLLPLGDLLQTLTWQPQSCGAIAQTISQQSTHPPLFFCLMHQWMGYLQGSEHSLRWQVRSLSALFGVGAIAIMYILNRVAFSHKAGLWAAGLMAVSPFAVYLSQEARHYTLPMLIIAASLIPLIQLCATDKPKLLPWLAWVGLSSLGFYVHYFCAGICGSGHHISGDLSKAGKVCFGRGDRHQQRHPQYFALAPRFARPYPTPRNRLAQV